MAKNKAIVQNINGIQFTLTSMPIAELKAFRNPSNNYRFDGSENVGGQTVKDSYDLQSLIEWILETKSIGDPIVLIDAIGENEVKQKILVRGNRRTASLEQIESMKLDSIQVKELLENVPVLVYTYHRSNPFGWIRLTNATWNLRLSAESSNPSRKGWTKNRSLMRSATSIPPNCPRVPRLRNLGSNT